MQGKRVLRRVGIGVGIAVGAILVLAVTGLLALRTHWGGGLARDAVVPRVNRSIAGQLDVGGLRFFGRSVELTGVTLRDPEGRTVASLGRVFVAMAPLALFRDHVDLREVTLEQPVLVLEQDARGLNLTRAFAPREPAPEVVQEVEESVEPSRLKVSVRKLALVGGAVSFRDRRPEGPPPVALEGLDSRGSAELDVGRQSIDARLALNGRTTSPLRAPLALALQAKLAGGAGDGRVTLDLGQTRVALAGRARDVRHATVTIQQIRVDPALVRAFVPSYPVIVPAEVTGQAGLRGDEVTADLHLGAASMRAELDVRADLARRLVQQLRLKARDIDVAAIVRDGPSSRFDLEVDGEGGGADASSLQGAVTLQVLPGARIQGKPFGPVRVRARADRGHYRLDELLAILPGLRVKGSGQGDRQSLAVDLEVRAQDLRLTGRSLGVPPDVKLSGRGDFTASVRGSPEVPVIDLRGHVPVLSAAGNSVDQLRLTAQVRGRTLPLQANVRLQAGALRTGGQRLGQVFLVATANTGGDFQLHAGAATPQRFQLRAGGRAIAGKGDLRTIELARLDLEYPQASWRLAHRARLVLDGEDVALDGLDLRADGGQQLQASFNRRGKRLEGGLIVAGLELARLPTLLVPPEKHLAGRVAAEVRLRGRLPRPDLDLQASLQGGRVDRFRDLAFTLTAAHRRGRASGELQAQALGADHRVKFDLPAQWPPAPGTPLVLELAVGEVDLARTLALLQHPLKDKVVGRAALTLEVKGPAGDPELLLNAQTRGLRVDREALGDIVLRVRDLRGQPLAVRLDTRVFGQDSQLTLDTPVVIGHWLRRPPTTDELMAVPFTLRATMKRLSLAAVTAQPGRRPPSVAGFVTARADLRGPIKQLQGELDVDLEKLQTATIPETGGTLRLRLGDGRAGAAGIDARLRLHRRQQVIVDLVAKLGAPVQRLLDRRQLGTVPVDIDGRVGPLVVQRVGLPAEGTAGGPRILRAQVHAQLTARGTPNAPVVKLAARIDDARMGDRSLGTADLKLGYKDRQSQLDAQITSANGGRLQLGLRAKADLSLAAVQDGLQIRDVPIDGRLSSRSLDLQVLSGLNDTVRAVAGLLDADGQFHGTIGTPQLAGQLAWKGGRLQLAGFGEFRDIDLRFRGDGKQMVLEKLFARSGEGSADVTGKATRGGDGRQLALEARAKLDRFSLYSEGQPLGALSLKATASGAVAPERIQVDVKIPEAHFYMAEGNRKQLQPLRRPDDVVIFEQGSPRDRREAKRLEALAERTLSRPAETSGRAEAKRDQPAQAEAGRKPATGQPRRMRINVDAEQNLWVKAPDINLELGLGPGFHVSHTDELRVLGVVKVKRGYVQVIGRRFDVRAGSSISFSGRPDQPRLAVDAEYNVRAARTPTTVAVRVEGPVDKLQFTLNSPEHPEYGDTELMSLVLAGRLPDDPGGGMVSGDRATSLVGGVLASRLQQTLAKRLPLDVLTIEAGEGLAGSRVEAGTYLGDDVYVAYVGRVGADPFLRQNRNEVHLEYQLTSRWSFEASYGDARQGGADLIWSKSY
jgi:translocation and assembly module TamB